MNLFKVILYLVVAILCSCSTIQYHNSDFGISTNQRVVACNQYTAVETVLGEINQAGNELCNNSPKQKSFNCVKIVVKQYKSTGIKSISLSNFNDTSEGKALGKIASKNAQKVEKTGLACLLAGIGFPLLGWYVSEAHQSLLGLFPTVGLCLLILGSLLLTLRGLMK